MSRLACIVLTVFAICISRTPAGEPGGLQQSMIWGESVSVGEQTYVVFRKRFESSEPLLDRIWQNSVNTVRTCSEDAYVDCAVRERTEWMADGYVQSYRVTRVALAGPAADGGPLRYGDPRLLRNLLRHIGQNGLYSSKSEKESIVEVVRRAHQLSRELQTSKDLTSRVFEPKLKSFV